MMIKVSNEFLEFDELIEVEKQIKLFEEISTTDGDFSYSFELGKTLTNRRLLQYPEPDNISKPVYQKIPANLLSDSGAELFKGYLRVERITEKYHCSFFAGNNNWFWMLSGKLRDIDWSEFDVEMTEQNLSAAIFNTSGTVFPLVDNGLLAYRGFALMKVEDFVGAIHLKDIFNKIFSLAGIKIQGELINDADYQSSVILNSNESQSGIDDRSTKAHATNSAIPNDGTFYLLEFSNDFDDPYYDGAADNFSLVTNRYTADVRMRVKVECVINTHVTALFFYMRVFKNGVAIPGVLAISSTSGINITAVVDLDAGDYIEIHISADPGHGNPTVIDDAVLTVTPVFVYSVFGNAMVPDWTQSEFVMEVFKNWNVLPSYNAQNMTLTLNLVEKLKSKPAIDLSEYVSAVETDYTEFISDYGKKSFLSHQETEAEEEFVKLKLQSRPYTKGQIDIDNDFLDDETDIIESKFSAPITYVNNVFAMSMEKTNLMSLETDTKIDFTSVIDSPATPGRARFAVPEDIFELSDLVRIENSTNRGYNGDYMVITLGAGYIELEGIAFDTDAFGEVTRMRFIYSGSDKVYLIRNVPLYSVIKFSANISIQVENTDYQTLSLGFYNIIRTNRPVDTDLPFSMAFADGDQTSLTERYYRLMSRVLNDPVKLFATATIPYHIYHQLDLLSPVKILTEETQNQYYLNRITGYKGPEYDVTLELIKI